MKLRNIIKNNKKWLLIISLAIIFRSTSALGMAGYSKYVFDSISSGNVSIYNVGIIGVLVVSWGAISLFLENLAVNLFIKHITFETSILFMKSLLKQPVSKLSDIGEGRLLTNYSQDINSIGLLIRNAIGLVKIPFEMVIASIYLIYTNWILGVSVLVLLPIITLIGNNIGDKMAKVSEAFLYKNDIIFRIISSSIKSINVIKAYSIESMIERDFENNSKDKYTLEKRQIKYSSFFSGLMDFFMGLPFAVIFILGALFYKSQALTVGTIMMFLQLLNKITVPFIQFNNIFIQYKQTKISLDRLNEVLEINDESLHDKLILDNTTGNIKFEKVSFKYKDKYIFDNFNLNVESGKYYGIIGENGSGKSTFAKLLVNLYFPNSGEIKINNHNLNSISMEDIRKNSKIVYVEDNPNILFEDIDKNIILNKLKDDQKFNDVLNKTGLSEFYNEIIEKSAEELSNGQKQRICLARGLYQVRNNTILVLDEPFSAMDSNIVKKLEKLILEYKEKNNLTIFEITHNLNNMDRFDYIYYFENGKVAMEGHHRELMNNSKYQEYILSFKNTSIKA